MTFTIDTENNISAFATPEEAAAATATPFDSFAAEQELSELAARWPAARFVAIWNSLPGVTPVKKFQNHQTAIHRIWKRIQGLGAPKTPQSERKAKRGAQSPKGVLSKEKPSIKTSRAKGAPKGPKKAAGAIRAGSKTARVIAMLRRQNGATISEIMHKMGWQKHTVRGFMAGAMKKAGYPVESFKAEGGERTCRINE
jgi:hypothetical protein